MGRRGGIKGQAMLEMQHSPSHSRPHGVDAQWVPFKSNTKFGVKIFYDKKTRDKTIRVGKQLANHGLHPEIFGEFDFAEDGCEKYAVIMERVPYTVEGGGMCKFEWSSSEESDMMDRLLDLGFHPWDLHFKNVGKMEDGRFVVLDVGHFEE